jgi:predicted RNA-binding protein YlqC (UPF0109 family)
VSAFDDEFGLFNDEVDDEERKPTLGARQIGSGETIIDDIEPEDEGARNRRRGGPAPSNGPVRGPLVRRRRRDERGESHAAEGAALERAGGLLGFLAKRLVSKPEAVIVETITEDDRGPVLELEVDHADLGKVIGRGGRVAQALRTLVRASAEGRVTIEIVDAENLDLDAVTEAQDEIDEFESRPAAKPPADAEAG